MQFQWPQQWTCCTAANSCPCRRESSSTTRSVHGQLMYTGIILLKQISSCPFRTSWQTELKNRLLTIVAVGRVTSTLERPSKLGKSGSAMTTGSDKWREVQEGGLISRRKQQQHMWQIRVKSIIYADFFKDEWCT